MHIGLIGGIGAAATVAYYQRLTAAVAARHQPLELTIVQADIRPLIANANSDGREAQARLFAPLIDRLRAAGADCAARVRIDADLGALPTHEWLRVGVPLKCLQGAGADMRRIDRPLRIETTGRLALALTRVELGTNPDRTLACTTR